jgi:hypothetical protein
MKIHPVWAQFFHADRRADMTKLTDAFRNFAKEPKMSCPSRELNQGSSVVHTVAYSLYWQSNSGPIINE